jgi:GTP-binding protein Era
MSFHSGFVSIIGKPNSGKSTLLNALMGEKISAVTFKAQTTRHRIKGILTGKDYQVVFSDTPGIITEKYELHKSMMNTVAESLEDADVLLVLLDPTSNLSETEELPARIGEVKIPVVIAVNKSDAIHKEKLDAFIAQSSLLFPGSVAGAGCLLFRR